MSAHTPGPWKTGHSDPWSVEHDRYGNLAWIGIKAKRKVVAIAMTAGRHENPEYQANARLIAAAPDLLAALQGLLSACDRFAERWAYDDEGKALADAARAAIARTQSTEA
jgi:hypothetical protein